jgi:hypothetical protein
MAPSGIRKYFEAPGRPGERMTVDDYYGYIFDNNVPGLPEKAAKEGLTPLEYMRKFGAVEVANDLYRQDERPLTETELEGAVQMRTGCCASRSPWKRRFHSLARPAPSASSWKTGKRLPAGSRHHASWSSIHRRLRFRLARTRNSGLYRVPRLCEINQF